MSATTAWETIGAHDGVAPRGRADRADAQRSRRCPACPSSRSTRRRTCRAGGTRSGSATPGEFPYTRGVYPSMYRGPALDHADVRRLRPARGHQRALQVPARAGADRALHRLRHAAADGLRRRPSAGARRGRPGGRRRSPRSPTSSALFAGIPLGSSHHVDDHQLHGVVILAMYLALADEQGVPWDQLGGTMQNDMLKEFIAQKEWISPAGARGAHRGRHDRVLRPARAALQPGVDLRLPHPRGRARPRCRSWPSRSPTASATCEAGVERGLDVDDFAPRLSFFFDIHNDFFEEIAKLRAARRIWATVMRDRFGATEARVHAAADPYPDRGRVRRPPSSR